MTTTVEIPWGTSTLAVRLPSSWRLDRRMGLARVFSDVEPFVGWAAARAPRAATAWLFPCGGVTYAAAEGTAGATA